MTMRDTLLDIAVLCMMARRGIAEESDVIGRIINEIKPFCDGSLADLMGNNCVRIEDTIAEK